MPFDRDHDTAVRHAAFAFLEEAVGRHQDSLPWGLLIKGFDYKGHRVPLVSMQGIFKPAVLDLPLTARTAALQPGQQRPYDDGFLDDGTVIYRYRGDDPRHRDNEGLRTLMRERIPLIYLHGTVKARYVAGFPAFIVGDDPASLTFRLDANPAATLGLIAGEDAQDGDGDVTGDIDASPPNRRYAMRLTRTRLHQRTFRDRVLAAYKKQCAVCHLRHVELLDAAHIVPDADPGGEPRVSNGLSLCKLHHGAYDAELFGIRPDLVIEVRPSILDESDGPMLRHGLQGIHRETIWTPWAVELQPDPEALERRYEAFRESA